MAITVTNNLYPPIFQSNYAPGFLYTQGCRIYFLLSDFNGAADLASTPLQVMVRKQSDNSNALKISLYPSEIKLTNMTQVEGKKYYFDLPSSDIQGGFNLNEYYKIQVRFTGAGASPIPAQSSGIDNWLSQNLEYFSQWSTVLLIYGISQPILTIKNFSQSGVNIFNDKNIPFVGSMSFTDSNDKETLKNYQLLIYDSNDNLLQTSKIIYTNSSAKNEINYTFSYNFQYNVNYKVKVSYTTKSLYTNEKVYTFKVEYVAPVDFDVYIKTQPIVESGCIKLTLRSKDVIDDPNYVYTSQDQTLTGKSLVLTLTDPDIAMFDSAYFVNTTGGLLLYTGASPLDDLTIGTRLVLRRSSSRNHFKTWDTINEIMIQQEGVIELIWFDCTVEPGTWYKYEVVRYKQEGQVQLISSIVTEKPSMVYTQDNFLGAGGEQLKIRYNSQLTNFSIKTSDTLIETIGSQFPYIMRNGNAYYRTFSLSGTITQFMNVQDNFFKGSKKDLYGQDILPFYDEFNQENDITPYNDYIHQRQFRNKVMQFLYNNNIKLFRSLTQGNILVKLMNITLTPNNQLGRLIYDFSCTAYEIDKSTYENYIKYNTKMDISKEIQSYE